MLEVTQRTPEAFFGEFNFTET